MIPQEVYEAIRQTEKRILLAAVDLCNGWVILKPEAFIQLGLDKKVVEAATEMHTSDGSWTGSIWDKDGKKVDYAWGISGLAFLELVSHAFGLKVPGFLGRGFQASAYKKAIREKLEG